MKAKGIAVCLAVVLLAATGPAVARFLRGAGDASSGGTPGPTQTISSITVAGSSSAASFSASTGSAVVGPVMVTMSPTSPPFAGTISLDSGGGNNTEGFTLSGSTSGSNLLAPSGGLAAGNYTDVVIRAHQSPMTDITINPVLTATAVAAADEEFVGPFANWLNAKSAPCNANGGGTVNDTNAIQTCLNLISSTSPWLYIPPGTYPVGFGGTATSNSVTSATCTGSISNTTMTLTSCSSGTPHVNDSFSWPGGNRFRWITNIGSCAGGSGTCTINITPSPALVGSTTFTFTTSTLTITGLTNSVTSMVPNLAVMGPGIERTSAILAVTGGPSTFTATLNIPPTAPLTGTTVGFDLRVYGQISVGITGASPSETILKEVGPGVVNDQMILLNSFAYSQFNRVTFDGNNVLNTNGVNHSNPEQASAVFFDTHDQYADDVWQNFPGNNVNISNAAYMCGAYGAGCSEVSILRPVFKNNSQGVWLGNFNALDVFVWYGLFQDNYFSTSNLHLDPPTVFGGGSGSFHVYNSNFMRSGGADIAFTETGLFSSRNNFSVGSRQYLFSTQTNNVAPNMIVGNTILDPTGPQSGNTQVIYNGDLGPVIAIDNKIRAGVNGDTVFLIPGFGGSSADYFGMGNTFSISNAGPASFASGHFHEIAPPTTFSQTIQPGCVAPTWTCLPVLPPTPTQHCSDSGTSLCGAHNDRKVFEVVSLTGAAIQTAINSAQAAAVAGAIHPVVHIPAGTYNVSSTITVPPSVLGRTNSGIQIIGDGNNSTLNWTGGSGGVVLQLQGSAGNVQKTILRDFYVSAGHNATCIEVQNVDQVGGRVFGEGGTWTGGPTNLFVDSLNNANVEMHDFYPSDDAFNVPSILVTGPGPVSTFAGSTSGNMISYSISGGAKLTVWDSWYENGGSPPAGATIANIADTSSLSFSGGQISIGSPGAFTAMTLNNYLGVTSLAGTITNNPINITGTSTAANVLSLGMQGLVTPYLNNSGGATIGLLNGFDSTPNEIAEIVPSTGFLTTTLNQLRTTQPTVPGPLPSGITDVRLYRITTANQDVYAVHLH